MSTVVTKDTWTWVYNTVDKSANNWRLTGLGWHSISTCLEICMWRVIFSKFIQFLYLCLYVMWVLIYKIHILMYSRVSKVYVYITRLQQRATQFWMGPPLPNDFFPLLHYTSTDVINRCRLIGHRWLDSGVFIKIPKKGPWFSWYPFPAQVCNALP